MLGFGFRIYSFRVLAARYGVDKDHFLLRIMQASSSEAPILSTLEQNTLDKVSVEGFCMCVLQ